jgi:hypothetical protein
VQWPNYILEDIILKNRKLTTKLDNEHAYSKYLETAIEKTKSYASRPTQNFICNKNKQKINYVCPWINPKTLCLFILSADP